ncbi:Uncharacterised protein [Mycobacteroides abscessus subsp. abscessus]|nr:Uncharacterised protein [Mycobacteroides abscessus subsp. abscessus]
MINFRRTFAWPFRSIRAHHDHPPPPARDNRNASGLNRVPVAIVDVGTVEMLDHLGGAGAGFDDLEDAEGDDAAATFVVQAVRVDDEDGSPARGSLPGGLAAPLVRALALFRERLIPAHREKLRSNQCQQKSVVYMCFLTETNLETSIDAARGYRRTSGNRRSKEAASATSGVGLPSASGCKDPMYQEVLSLSCAPERRSGALCLSIS